MNEEKNREIVSELTAWAMENNRTISVRMIKDTLKDRNNGIEDEDIEKTIYFIEKHGVRVFDEADEDYDGYEKVGDDFIPADVNIGMKNISLDIIVSRLKEQEIDLFPDFQRNADLWSIEQKSRLIESLMLRIPIPSFYFDASDDDKWVVIDGLQRLSTINGYVVKQAFVLTGLEYLTEFEGLSFQQLPRQYVRRIMETQLVVYTVERGTPQRIIFNIFKRLNTGGLVLTSQEIRCALNQGKIVEQLRKMAKTKEFLIATGYSIKSDRMQDCEYAIRFLTFKCLGVSEYQGNIDDYLNLGMAAGNNMSDEELDRVYMDYSRALKFTYDILGKYSFRRVRGNGGRGPINKALFETFLLAVSERSDEELRGLVLHREQAIERYKRFTQINADMFKAGDKYTLNRRFQLVDEFMGELVNDYADTV